MELRLKFSHFRVPQPWEEDAAAHNGRKMEPPIWALVPYSRRYGFDFSESIADGAYPSVPPSHRGGATRVQAIDKDGNIVAEEVAVCSMSDKFCYARGRQIAKGRLLKRFIDHEK